MIGYLRSWVERLRADHIKRNGLVRVATEAPHFQVRISNVQCVA
jgi:hypothetical protein